MCIYIPSQFQYFADISSEFSFCVCFRNLYRKMGEPNHELYCQCFRYCYCPVTD